MAPSSRARRLRTLARRPPPGGPQLAALRGPARLGDRTKALVKRLRPGEIAVIDHADLDRVAAEDLASSDVAAVVNVAPFSTGRYPNAGPLLLARAGVRLVEVPAAPLFDGLRDGDVIELAGGKVRLDGTVIAAGQELTVALLEARLDEQRARVDEALSEFAENTIAHVREEGELLVGGLALPALRTDFRDRHALIVVRGTTYRKDLRTLRAYIDDARPVLVGVDGGADAIREEGFEPDVILGDMDSASDAALRSGAELIVHAYPDGRAPGRERLMELGLEHAVIPAPATSQDVAMLLAHEKGASLIVAVGAHFNLVEFLDKNRSGMASTFLTRLRVGETLVDAKGVSSLYNPGIAGTQVALFVAAALILVVIVVLSLPELSNLVDLVWLKIKVLLGL
ncbi:MAG: putative cytokinetic ring protein SteA [Solirubrobacterales bacterium]